MSGASIYTGLERNHPSGSLISPETFYGCMAELIHYAMQWLSLLEISEFENSCEDTFELNKVDKDGTMLLSINSWSITVFHFLLR